jgi:hypothetical protein
MAGRLHKSTNFEPVNKNQAGTLATNAADVTFDPVGTWKWNKDDEWKDTVSGRFIMDVSPGMTLESLNNGRRTK